MKTQFSEFRTVANTFAVAALDKTHWGKAVEGLATVSGFRAGQLVGFDRETSVLFNFYTGIDSTTATADYLATGGGNPARNPRLQASYQSPLMKSLVDSECASTEEFNNSPFYAEFCRAHGISHCCIIPLLRDETRLMGIGAFQSLKEGPATNEQRRIFELLAPHAQTALRTQLVLEDSGVLVLKGALDALSLPVFLCDRSRIVRTMTAMAERVLTDAGPLQLKDGRLCVSDAGENNSLTKGIQIAIGSRDFSSPGVASTVVVRDSRQRPIILDILPMPVDHHSFNFQPSALIVLRGYQRGDERLLELLQSAWRLTPAEADIALALSNGERPQAIANLRNVTINTVRVQIRNIFSKLGVNRLSELVACLRQI